MLRPIMRRRMSVTSRRRRSGSVSFGAVDTVYSTVVGDGRRVRRWGWIVNIAAGCVASGSHSHILC